MQCLERGKFARFVLGFLLCWSPTAVGAGDQTVRLNALCGSRDGEQQRLRKGAGSVGAVVHFSAKNQSQDFPLSGSGSFFGKVEEACGVERYDIEGNSLVLSYGSARYGEKYVYSLEKRYVQLVQDESVDCPIDWRIHYAPLSLVGSVFSYEENSDGSSACGPMGLYDMVAVVDLATGKPVKVTELLEEGSLLAALKVDRFLRAQGENQADAEYAAFVTALDGARTLEELSGALAQKFAFRLEETLKRFAFFDYDAGRDLVATRLAILDSGMPTMQKYAQVGVLVRPKKDKKALFVNAKKGAGFFLGRYPNTLVRIGGKKR